MLPPDENRDDRHQQQSCDCKAESKAVEDSKCSGQVVSAQVSLVDHAEGAGILGEAQATVVQGDIFIVCVSAVQRFWQSFVEKQVDEAAGM